MDELDQLLIGQTLEGGWVVQEPRHLQRDAPSASRAYLASNSKGTKAFVKVLDPGPMVRSRRLKIIYRSLFMSMPSLMCAPRGICIGSFAGSK
jgi:hypothetical protein